MHVYSPWWLNNADLDFPRGYHIEPWGGKRSMPRFGIFGGVENYPSGGGWGRSLKEDYRRYYGAVVGFCTSGGYSHHAQKSIALGFVPTDRAQDGLEVEIEILGKTHAARLITTPLFDADGARMRGL